MPKRKPAHKPSRERYKTTKNLGSPREFTRWWDVEEDEVAEALEDRAAQLWEDDSVRRDDISANLLRWGLSLSGLYKDNTTQLKGALRLNITKQITETITAKIGKLRPRPLILTDDGKYANKLRAKKLQRFMDAVYKQADVYDIAPSVFRNAMLMDAGVIYVGGNAHRQRFEVENVFPIEVLVDNVEAARGEKHTRTIHRVYPVDKDALLEDYGDDPKVAAAIESANAWGPDALDGRPTVLAGKNRDVRTATVTEGWRKARYNAKGDLVPGRHVLACNGVALLDEEWTSQAFPFEFHFWNPPVRGFWGDSAISEIRGMEKEANVNLQRAQDAMRRIGMPIVLAHIDANIQESKLTNEPGTVLRWEGQIPPTVTVSTPVSPQIMEQPERLIRLAANQIGTNELQLSATKPAGVESGRAMEQLSEEHSVRFDTVSKSFEAIFSKGLALQFVRTAKQMDECLKRDGKPGLRLRSTYKKEFIDLKWDDVELGPDELFIDVWPVSVLPQHPAAKTAEVERWQANKWVTNDQAKALLDFPDMESFSSVSRASFELLEWQLGQMLDEGNPVMPDQRQDLQNSLSFGTLAKFKAQREGVAEENIQLLEDFLSVIENWLKPEPAPQDVAALGAPMDSMPPVADPLGQNSGLPMPTDLAGPGAGATAPVMPMAGTVQL